MVPVRCIIRSNELNIDLLYENCEKIFLSRRDASWLSGIVLDYDDGSELKTSVDERVGLWSGPSGVNCWISFAPVFSCVYCWVLIFV